MSTTGNVTNNDTGSSTSSAPRKTTAMHETAVRWMLRRLSGEPNAAEARQLDRLLADDPALARDVEQLRAIWEQLEGPPTPRRDDTLTRQIVARAAAESRSGFVRQSLLSRLAATAALFLGTWLGLSLEPTLHPERPATTVARQTTPATEAIHDFLSLETPFFGDATSEASDFVQLALEDGELERLSGEEIFAPPPTLAESYWLVAEAASERPPGEEAGFSPNAHQERP